MMGSLAHEIQIGRLLVMHAAWCLDQGSFARKEISSAKIHVANTLHKVADTAIQLNGARGYSKIPRWNGFIAMPGRRVWLMARMKCIKWCWHAIMTHKAAIIGIGVFEVVQEAPFSVEQLSLYLAETLAADQVVIDEIHPFPAVLFRRIGIWACRLLAAPFMASRHGCFARMPLLVSAPRIAGRLNMRCYPMRSRTPFLRQSLSAYARIRR